MASPLSDSFWTPITADRPGGPDLALAPELDELRAARKGDDPGLAQGDWVRELHPPQWPRVRELCETILATRSKDLQVACWYAEALARLEGFPGLARGLATVDGILDRFWDSCHPALEGPSAEARIGRLEWADRNLALAARMIPLTAVEAGGHTWLQWEEARAVDNLGLRNPQARDAAVREGKLSGEAIQKAVLGSGAAFYAVLQDGIGAARSACRGLQATLERRLGAENPGLEILAEALAACAEFTGQARQRFFPPAPGAPAPAQAPPPPASGPLRSRAEAILTLRATATFLQATEPHSPVALLVARAARWAELSFDAWLAEVIKDPQTLAQLRELLNLEQEIKHS